MAQCLEQIPGHQLVGGRARQFIDEELDLDPGLVERVCGALGSNQKVAEVIPNGTIDRLRAKIQQMLQDNGHPPPELPTPNVA